MDITTLALAKKYTNKVVSEIELQGKDGVDGKSAYQYAVDGGYQGTEEEFIQSMNIIPFLDDRLTTLENKLAKLNYQSDTNTYTLQTNLNVEGKIIEKNNL